MRLFHGWHQRTRMKINFHSCGSIVELLKDLVECEVDVLNPIQLSSANMEPEKIRNIVGQNMVLYGGAFDCVQTPPSTDAELVYQQVKKNIAALAREGNYLFAGVHNTAATTPRSHIEAVLRAYQDMRNMYK